MYGELTVGWLIVLISTILVWIALYFIKKGQDGNAKG